MDTLYKSKKGDIKTKEGWIEHAKEFYVKIKHKDISETLPERIWERFEKVLEIIPLIEEPTSE